ncbi:MAG: porin family protein [Rhodospirillales bacterium]|nr:porin family protein [Rhodospirillales bacterium]
MQGFSIPIMTLWCSAALAACLLLALPAWGAQHESGPPISLDSPDAAGLVGGEAEARALMDAGRFMDAVTILGPLVQGEEIEANTLFLYGLAAMGASQQADVPEDTRAALLDQAIASFHAMLIEAPGLVRVRLELARAFYLQGEDDLAQRHFEAVLAGGVPEAVAANVQRFLKEIRGRGRWSFRLGAALAPDSNIGGTSDERTIYIFNLPFQRDAEELTTSGIGVSVWGGAEYQVSMREWLRLRAGSEFARREYERSEFDQFFLSGHAGPRFLVDGATDVSVLASARQRWLGTVPDHRDLGGRLEVGRRLTPRVTLSGQASWHGRRYRTRTYLDGPVWDTALRGSWAVTPTVRAELSGGYGRDRPRSMRERNRSRWVGAGVTVILPLGFTVGTGGEYRWADYGEGWGYLVPEGGAREDRTWNVRASVHNRAFTLAGFSPELVAVHEERESNAQAHDYDRTRGELRFVRQF